MDLPKPDLTHICDYTVELASPIELGDGPAGQRRIVPITGGTVEGERLSGTIISLGADWQTVYRNGVAELDTRYAIQTHDGAIIDVRNFGYRHGPTHIMEALAKGEEVDPQDYSMRTMARLETGDPRYDWVNRSLFVGTGARLKQSVQIGLYLVV